MKVVFSIGGSILAPDGVDENYVSVLAEVLAALAKDNQLAVVVGGGRPARKKIAEEREKGATWARCDHVGILATRDNAKALIKKLGSLSNQKVPESVKDGVRLFGGKVLVMGGTEPGHSTDAVAALIADWVAADVFINASNVDAVYDKNPKKHKDAKPLTKIHIDALMALLKGEGVNAGEYPLLDHVALNIIQRSKIRTVFVNGRDLDNLRAAAEGKPFNGTTVVY
jgi:uridylate kinase